MYYDKKALFIISICIFIGVLLIVFGIITSEIEINRNQYEEIYGNTNN